MHLIWDSNRENWLARVDLKWLNPMDIQSECISCNASYQGFIEPLDLTQANCRLHITEKVVIFVDAETACTHNCPTNKIQISFPKGSLWNVRKLAFNQTVQFSSTDTQYIFIYLFLPPQHRLVVLSDFLVRLTYYMCVMISNHIQ